MPQPRVYVIILNWNLREDTAECISSVGKSSYSNYHTLVVDNGSTDGSAEYLSRSFPEVDLVVNPHNLGFAAGNNIGLRHALAAGADYAFLLNNDAVVDIDTLSQLVECAEGDQRIGLVAPKILYYTQRDRIWRLGDRVSRWLPVPVSVGRNVRDRGQFAAPFAVDYVTFCGVLIRRQVLETVGLLDERFFFSYEDADLCRRAQNVGFLILCEPRAQMWHKASLSTQKDAARVRYFRAKSRALFYRRYAHGPHPWLTTAYVWGSTLLSALGPALRGDSSHAAQAVRGLYEGYHERLEDS